MNFEKKNKIKPFLIEKWILEELGQPFILAKPKTITHQNELSSFVANLETTYTLSKDWERSLLKIKIDKDMLTYERILSNIK